MNKKKKYAIIGVAKAGSSSLGEYLRRKGYDVIEMEMEFMNKDYKLNDRIPIIITRDPIERAWSHYNYFNETIEQSCECSKYEKYIPLWKNPIMFDMEQLKKLKDFPHHNENTIKPKLDNIHKSKIIMEISK